MGSPPDFSSQRRKGAKEIFETYVSAPLRLCEENPVENP